LFVNDSTGVVDGDESDNPRIVAATWQVEIHWGRKSGGAGMASKSVDGGVTESGSHRPPTTKFGRVGLAIAPNRAGCTR
jgi:hypothetical protein